jgi:hypothetical protein
MHERRSNEKPSVSDGRTHAQNGRRSHRLTEITGEPTTTAPPIEHTGRHLPFVGDG